MKNQVDTLRVQCEAIALKIYNQLDTINMEANYAGQVQQCEQAVTDEWCLRVADIIQKEVQTQTALPLRVAAWRAETVKNLQ